VHSRRDGALFLDGAFGRETPAAFKKEFDALGATKTAFGVESETHKIVKSLKLKVKNIN